MPSSPKEPERRFFLCTEEVATYSKLHEYPGRHIIGEILYVNLHGVKVTALAQWLVPIPTDEVPPLSPEIIDEKIGNSQKIKCRFEVEKGKYCGKYSTWEIGRVAFNQLMKRYGYTLNKSDEMEKIPISKSADV